MLGVIQKRSDPHLAIRELLGEPGSFVSTRSQPPESALSSRSAPVDNALSFAPTPVPIPLQANLALMAPAAAENSETTEDPPVTENRAETKRTPAKAQTATQEAPVVLKKPAEAAPLVEKWGRNTPEPARPPPIRKSGITQRPPIIRGGNTSRPGTPIPAPVAVQIPVVESAGVAQTAAVQSASIQSGPVQSAAKSPPIQVRSSQSLPAQPPAVQAAPQPAVRDSAVMPVIPGVPDDFADTFDPTPPGAPFAELSQSPAPEPELLHGAAPEMPGAQGFDKNLYTMDGVRRVAVHLRDGSVKRGSIENQKLIGANLLMKLSSGESEEFRQGSLKAVFILSQSSSSSVASLPTAKATPEGKRVAVDFHDRRTVEGYSTDLENELPGFFLIPSTPIANTERIFIYRAAVAAINIV